MLIILYPFGRVILEFRKFLFKKTCDLRCYKSSQNNENHNESTAYQKIEQCGDKFLIHIITSLTYIFYYNTRSKKKQVGFMNKKRDGIKPSLNIEESILFKPNYLVLTVLTGDHADL